VFGSQQEMNGRDRHPQHHGRNGHDDQHFDEGSAGAGMPTA